MPCEAIGCSIAASDKGSRSLARRDFTYEFSKGERIGICGPNGSGKTTLVRTLTGALPLAAGEREVGDTTVIGHFAQQPPPVPEHLRIIDYLRSGLNPLIYGCKP